MHGFCLVRDTEICEVCYGLPSGESSVVNNSTTNGSSPKDLSAAIDSTLMDESDRNLGDALANSNITQKDSTAIDSTLMDESDRNLGDALANSNFPANEDHFPANFVIDDRWKEKMGSHDPILILSELLALYETTAVDRDIILIMLGSDFENQHERAKTLGLERKILRQKFNKIEDELDYIISKY